MPDDSHDLAPVLKHLNRKRESARRRLANDPATRRFLDAGLRLIADELGVGRYKARIQDSEMVFFHWVKVPSVVKEASHEGKATPWMHRDRWKTRDDFVKDLMAYVLWSQHWTDHTKISQHSSSLLTGDHDIVDAIKQVAYDDLDSLLVDAAPRISLVITAIAARDEAARKERAKLYATTHREWAKLYADTLAARGWKLRPDVTIDQFTDILTAVAEGLALRSIGDPDAKVIDHQTKESLLGKAALAMAAACLDPGDGRPLEEIVRRISGP